MIVQKQTFPLSSLQLACGRTLHDVRIGYETYGTLNAAGDNAILITHYFSGTSHAAGRFSEADVEPGYWDAIIGPGKAIDTDRYFVISADSLANVNAKMKHVVTTGPASIDPQTQKPYASSFPVVTIGDFVDVQKALCDALGVKHLHAVAGPSMGAMQALEWAARYPAMLDRVIAVVPPGLYIEPYLSAMLDVWCSPLVLDSDFAGGDYYGRAEPVRGLVATLKLITFMALHHGWARRFFGAQPRWADDTRDPLQSIEHRYAIDATLTEVARDRARVADANSILRIARAVQLFSVRDRIADMRARFLFIPAESDLLILPAYAERGISELRAAGLSVETFLLKGDGGHLDGLQQIARAADPIRGFLTSS